MSPELGESQMATVYSVLETTPVAAMLLMLLAERERQNRAATPAGRPGPLPGVDAAT